MPRCRLPSAHPSLACRYNFSTSFHILHMRRCREPNGRGRCPAAGKARLGRRAGRALGGSLGKGEGRTRARMRAKGRGRGPKVGRAGDGMRYGEGQMSPAVLRCDCAAAGVAAWSVWRGSGCVLLGVLPSDSATNEPNRASPNRPSAAPICKAQTCHHHHRSRHAVPAH